MPVLSSIKVLVGPKRDKRIKTSLNASFETRHCLTFFPRKIFQAIDCFIPSLFVKKPRENQK